MKKILSIFIVVFLCITQFTVSAEDAITIDFGDIAGIAGDVDVDTYINTTDLATLKKIMLDVNIPQSEKTADVNEDGKIDVCDLVKLKKLLAEIGQ